MPNYDNEFTRLIKYLRANAELSLRALGDKAGLSSVYLCDLEKGCRPPTKNVLERLCAAYNLDNDAQRLLYDAAGSATQSVPFDVQEYLINNPDALARVIAEMQVNTLESGTR